MSNNSWLLLLVIQLETCVMFIAEPLCSITAWCCNWCCLPILSDPSCGAQVLSSLSDLSCNWSNLLRPLPPLLKCPFSSCSPCASSLSSLWSLPLEPAPRTNLLAWMVPIVLRSLGFVMGTQAVMTVQTNLPLNATTALPAIFSGVIKVAMIVALQINTNVMVKFSVTM